MFGGPRSSASAVGTVVGLSSEAKVVGFDFDVSSYEAGLGDGKPGTAVFVVAVVVVAAAAETVTGIGAAAVLVAIASPA